MPAAACAIVNRQVIGAVNSIDTPSRLEDCPMSHVADAAVNVGLASGETYIEPQELLGPQWIARADALAARATCARRATEAKQAIRGTAEQAPYHAGPLDFW